MGAYSRWALIRGWALIRINTVISLNKNNRSNYSGEKKKQWTFPEFIFEDLTKNFKSNLVFIVAIPVTFIKMQPHNSQSSRENATPFSGTHPLDYTHVQYSRPDSSGQTLESDEGRKMKPEVQ